MRRTLRVWLGAGLLLLPPALSLARPGGGDSFSMPSDGGGGGGGGDAIEIVILLLRLVFMFPKLGVPLLLLGVIAVWWISRKGKLEEWHTEHSARAAPSSARSAADLSALRKVDPDFSAVLFEDFAYRLYASVQRARGDASALGAIAPYLSDSVRAELSAQTSERVTHVVIGAMRVVDLQVPAAQAEDARANVQLHYVANVTFQGGRTLYVEERWLMSRAASARTKPLANDQALGCPNCGAPFRASDNRRCEYCNEVVSDGRFAWVLDAREVEREQQRPPALTGNVQERGTDKPSVRAPNSEAMWRNLTARDAKLSEQALYGRVSLLYGELNRAYSARDLAPVRGFLSDGMFDYLRYWTDAYRAQQLENVLEDMRISRIERVKVSEDRFYDAVTVRLFASGVDYTRKLGSREVVSGDPKKTRAYSEYWTLIRSAGVSAAPRTDKNCPNCAAPLETSMAGTCVHCQAHVTSGEFDWVLSKIEQDDVYVG